MHPRSPIDLSLGVVTNRYDIKMKQRLALVGKEIR